MANFNTLKTEIAKVIKANGVQSITGANFQAQLFAIIDGINEAKVDVEAGKGLSHNDLTDALVSKINSAVQAAGLSSAIADAIATCILKSDLVQAGGTDATKVMSQKAVTDALNLKANNAEVVHKADLTTQEGSSGTKVMTQGAVTNSLARKANASEVYTKTEVDTAIGGKADKANTYTKQEVNAQVATRVSADDVYLKNEIDNKLADKAKASLLDKEVADRIAGDNALSQSLAGKANASEVYTKGQADAITNAIASALGRMARDFGRYANPTEQVLQNATQGKYVDAVTGLAVNNSAYSISRPVNLLAGDILLIPSASAVLAACSVVSRIVTNTYDKAILYTYTYDEQGRIATAKADYNSAIYTAHYPDDETNAPDYWIYGAEHLTDLPATHSVTESFYEPLVKQSVAAMPDEGYYVYLASRNMDVVISAFNATINGGKIIKVGWGIFKNIATNFVGHPQQRVIADYLCNLAERVAGIEDKLLNGLDLLKVGHLIIGHELGGLNVNGNMCLQGAGAPAEAILPVNWDFATYGDWKGIPQFIGQEYVDTTNKVCYKACGVDAVSDWKRITNA